MSDKPERLHDASDRPSHASELLPTLSPQQISRLRENWQAVVDDVAAATVAAGRQQDDVKIVGVTKYVDAAMTAALVRLGCHDLGENRPQVLWKKADAFNAETQRNADDVLQPTWHQIGHLQTNKVRRLIRHRPVIHSVDSEKLLRVIADESASQGATTTCLLEINVSGDESKTGMPPEQLESCLAAFGHSDSVSMVGIMAMAGWGTDGATAKSQFATVRHVRNDLQKRLGIPLPELSMGMSGDFREAIEEGATFVRIGSRLFEGLRDAD